VRRDDNLATFMCRLSSNLGASCSWNTQGLSRAVKFMLYFYVTTLLCRGTRSKRKDNKSFLLMFIGPCIIFIVA